jgi:hypothetical protein
MLKIEITINEDALGGCSTEFHSLDTNTTNREMLVGWLCTKAIEKVIHGEIPISFCEVKKEYKVKPWQSIHGKGHVSLN